MNRALVIGMALGVAAVAWVLWPLLRRPRR